LAGEESLLDGKSHLSEKPILAMSNRIMDFITHKNAMVVSGACGQHECWHVDQDGGKGLGETCATAHLIWFMDSLFRMSGEPLYGDFMERIIYNTLFAAQSPDGRRLRYYTPMEGERRYFGKDTYCCPGNYRRIVSDLPRMAYYRANNGIVINLYTESSAKTVLGDDTEVSIAQQTDYPNSGKVRMTIRLSRPTDFRLLLRIPRWCHGARIAVDGADQPYREEGGRFAVLKRLWKDGDRIEIDMPMEWRFIRGREKQSGRAAVMRGPVLFAFDPASNGIDVSESLEDLSLDLNSVSGPFPSDRIRPGGLSCRARIARGESSGAGANRPVEAPATLMEFVDPQTRLTYFRVPESDQKHLTDDELFF
jgi:DUF1680 family protein